MNLLNDKIIKCDVRLRILLFFPVGLINPIITDTKLLLNCILPKKRLHFATSKYAVVMEVIRLPGTIL